MKNTIYIIASILGIIFFIASPLFKKKKDILISQIGAAFCYMIAYIIKGATSAWLIEIIEQIKDLIIIRFERKKKNVPGFILAFFILLLIVVTIIFYDGYYSITPLIINIAYFISTYFKNPKHIRYTMLVCAFLWAFYNYSVGAYIIIVGNVFEVISATYSIVKYKKSQSK